MAAADPIAPRKREPVSPIKILAGCTLNTKKATDAPISADEIKAAS